MKNLCIVCLLFSCVLCFFFFVHFVCIVRSSGWISTRRNRDRPGFVIDLTTQPELAAAVAAENHHQPNVQNDMIEEPTAVAANHQPNQLNVENDAIEEPTAVANVNHQVAQVRDAAVQANPQQDELVQLQQMLKFTYGHFARTERYQRLYHNYISPLLPHTDHHCRVMSKIGTYFINGQADIDPDVIAYLSDFRTISLRQFSRSDKVRMNIMNLEIERKTVEYERKRLRDAELANRDEQRKMICMVCMVKDVEPGVRLKFVKCGHICCRDCMHMILSSNELQKGCGYCRTPIRSPSETISAFFKFNARKEAVCRHCYKPFNDDGTIIKMPKCGHPYHELCLKKYSPDRCNECSYEYSGDDDVITLFGCWV